MSAFKELFRLKKSSIQVPQVLIGFLLDEIAISDESVFQLMKCFGFPTGSIGQQSTDPAIVRRPISEQ